MNFNVASNYLLILYLSSVQCVEENIKKKFSSKPVVVSRFIMSDS